MCARTKRWARAVAAVSVLLLATACGGDDDADAANQRDATESSSTEPPSASSVPAELVGRWETELPSGDSALPTLYETGLYQVASDGNAAGGAIAVEGDRIVFSRHKTCDGIGTYRWAVAADVLTLAAMDDDRCPRALVLEAGPFTRDA